jgi:hypothetical protein
VASATKTDEGVVYGFTNGTANSTFSVALGYNAGGATQPNPSLIGNAVVGVIAGRDITTGHNNAIIGNEAGRNVTTGSYLVFAGSGAGALNTTGDANVAIGQGALGANTTADNNVAVGYRALSNTTGAGNTAVGDGAGGDYLGGTLTGSNNTSIGNAATPSTTSVSNEITLGNSSVTALRCQVTTITSLSDSRDKTDVKPINYGLDLINELNPVQFTWHTRDGAKVGLKDMGFIAQELAKVEDQHDAETLQLTYRTNPERLEASQGRLIPILVKAIQELSARIEELENAR